MPEQVAMSQRGQVGSIANGQDRTLPAPGAAVIGERAAAPGTWRRIVTTYRQNPLAMISIVVLILIGGLALLTPLIDRYPPTQSYLRAFEAAPSADHWLGTDSAGRDIWSRLLWGARTSITVAVAAVTISIVIGTLIGAISGYFGGAIDTIMMRVTDGFIAFPDIVLVLMLASILGPSIRNVILVIGILGWTGMARLVRGQFLILREQDWVLAARSVGVSNGRLITRHLLPHVLTQIVVAATFGAASATLTEAGLSYLGLGVQPPAPSWGAMLAEAQSVHVLQNVPWAWMAPGITLTVTVLAVSYVGDTLRKALTPG
jgi:peptide/nickel transport system permease protein